MFRPTVTEKRRSRASEPCSETLPHHRQDPTVYIGDQGGDEWPDLESEPRDKEHVFGNYNYMRADQENTDFGGTNHGERGLWKKFRVPDIPSSFNEPYVTSGKSALTSESQHPKSSGSSTGQVSTCTTTVNSFTPLLLKKVAYYECMRVVCLVSLLPRPRGEKRPGTLCVNFSVCFP